MDVLVLTGITDLKSLRLAVIERNTIFVESEPDEFLSLLGEHT